MKIKRNIMISKAGGNAGKNSVGYKICLPADMVKKIGVTPNNREVYVYFENGKIVIEKDNAKNLTERLESFYKKTN